MVTDFRELGHEAARGCIGFRNAWRYRQSLMDRALESSSSTPEGVNSPAA